MEDDNNNNIIAQPKTEIQKLWRPCYKYHDRQGTEYILVFYESNDPVDGDVAVWSKYTYTDDPIGEGNTITPDKEFQDMLLSEKWINDGYDMVVSR